MISVVLMSKDLDFNIPHKLNRANIKNNILKEIEEEEKRLQEINLSQQQQEEKERQERQRRKMNYENYFDINPNCKTNLI
jgi:hypothetical protein